MIEAHNHCVMCLTRIPWILRSSIFTRNLVYSTRIQQRIYSERQLASNAAATKSVNGASDLRIERIKINSHTGEVIRFDAVIQVISTSRNVAIAAEI